MTAKRVATAIAVFVLGTFAASGAMAAVKCTPMALARNCGCACKAYVKKPVKHTVKARIARHAPRPLYHPYAAYGATAAAGPDYRDRDYGYPGDYGLAENQAAIADSYYRRQEDYGAGYGAALPSYPQPVVPPAPVPLPPPVPLAGIGPTSGNVIYNFYGPTTNYFGPVYGQGQETALPYREDSRLDPWHGYNHRAGNGY